MSNDQDKQREPPEQRIRTATVRICQDCVDLKGEECHTPECVFCFRSVTEAKWLMDQMMIAPVINGERFVLVDDDAPDLAQPLLPDQQKIVEIRNRLSNITPWPWWCGGGAYLPIEALVNGGAVQIGRAESFGQISDGECEANGRFIAHAPEDIAYLLSLLSDTSTQRCVDCHHGSETWNPVTALCEFDTDPTNDDMLLCGCKCVFGATDVKRGEQREQTCAWARKNPMFNWFDTTCGQKVTAPYAYQYCGHCGLRVEVKEPAGVAPPTSVAEAGGPCGAFKPSALGVPEPQDRCALPLGHEGKHTLTTPDAAAEYREGDLEKFFGIDPDFTGDKSTSEYVDSVRGGPDAAPTDDSAEGELRHLAVVPFIAVCGADMTGQKTTDNPEHVTCDVCLAFWRRRFGQTPSPSVSPGTEPWFDAGGCAWEIRRSVDCVECPHCAFTFDAIHTSGDSNGYECPNCEGCPNNVLVVSPDEEGR